MATAAKLLSILGRKTTGAAFQGILKADQLKVQRERGTARGEPVIAYYSGKKAGYQVLTSDDRVVCIFLHVERDEGFSPFPGSLPYGIERGATRTATRRLLGKPESSGKAGIDSLLGPQCAWDRFVLESTFVHIEYSSPGLQVHQITLMTENAAP